MLDVVQHGADQYTSKLFVRLIAELDTRNFRAL